VNSDDKEIIEEAHGLWEIEIARLSGMVSVSCAVSDDSRRRLIDEQQERVDDAFRRWQAASMRIIES
jgi:hypothetical protein